MSDERKSAKPPPKTTRESATAAPTPEPKKNEPPATDASSLMSFVENYGAIVLVVVSVFAAIQFAFMERPAISALILAGITLLATVFALWNSVRTLAGDGEIPEAFKDARFEVATSRQRLLEQKKSVLRALKDLENERAIGKITDEDFEDVAVRYRDEAKGILRQLDAVGEEHLQKAEALAEKHLRAKGLLAPASEEAATTTTEDASSAADPDDAPEVDEGENREAQRTTTRPPPAHADSQALDAAAAEEDGDRTMVARHICPHCAASNEFDAKFCKACAKPLKVGDSK